jgi:hypothetical protein
VHWTSGIKCSGYYTVCVNEILSSICVIHVLCSCLKIQFQLNVLVLVNMYPHTELHAYGSCIGTCDVLFVSLHITCTLLHVQCNIIHVIEKFAHMTEYMHWVCMAWHKMLKNFTSFPVDWICGVFLKLWNEQCERYTYCRCTGTCTSWLQPLERNSRAEFSNSVCEKSLH